MKILHYKKGDNEKIKQFVSKNIEEIFHSPASGLDDLNSINNNFELFLVARDNKKIVGTIGVKKEDNCARISRMYVDKSHKGKGIGKILIEKALDYCKGRFNMAFLTTYEQMGSVGFYEKMGFKIFKKEKDIIFMEMILNKAGQQRI
jgi:GNAT superfamily N-acetyltransferase